MNENTERLFALLDGADLPALAHVEERDDMVALAQWLDDQGVKAPPPPPPPLPAGWAFPHGATKAHYFEAEGTRSLCGRWGQFDGRVRTPDDHRSPDDCASCRRKVDRAAGRG